MPLSYGGGVNSIEQVKKLLYLGYEKLYSIQLFLIMLI